LTTHVYLRTFAVVGAVVAAALGGPRAASTAGINLPARSVGQLGLTVEGFPSHATLTDQRIDRNAKAVDHESLLATAPASSTQGRRYAAADFYGSFYQYTLLPRYTVQRTRHGRSVQLMATIFPTEAAAAQAWQDDVDEVVTTYGCTQVSDHDVPAHQFTCTFDSGASNAFVIAQHGNVEFITYGFVDYIAPASVAVALRDAVEVAHNELFHVLHIVAAVDRAGR